MLPGFLSHERVSESWQRKEREKERERERKREKGEKEGGKNKVEIRKDE